MPDDRDDALMADLADRLGVPRVDADERTAVLDLTRVVAHGVERRFGPITAYALGLAAGAAGHGTDDGTGARVAALRRAIAVLEDDPPGGTTAG